MSRDSSLTCPSRVLENDSAMDYFSHLFLFEVVLLKIQMLLSLFAEILYSVCAEACLHNNGALTCTYVFFGLMFGKATSGLGAAAAYALSKEGFYVVLVGRSSQLLAKAVSDIKSRNRNACLKAFEVDLSSFKSILEFKHSLQRWLLDSDIHSSVQLLINNAGILATSRRFTSEGYDQMLATNYIGAFCLTKVLLPLLENSPVPSRVVNVTSFTHWNGRLTEKLSLGSMAFLVLRLLGLLQSSETGVCSIIDAALAPPEVSGVYFFGGNGRSLNSSALSYDARLAKDLWDTSCNLFQELQLSS
ncbi:hypothetical protein DH2020_032697 [Rehmannia glutinosa]|uniref:Uncharacterized protein n=1 Tax=Rehmannia glutinosa TaxID=99300 RepID=A0ABR0VEF9_REHGL